MLLFELECVGGPFQPIPDLTQRIQVILRQRAVHRLIEPFVSTTNVIQAFPLIPARPKIDDDPCTSVNHDIAGVQVVMNKSE